MIEVRLIHQSEIQEVKNLGKKTFEWFESLFVPKPSLNRCYVAIENNQIVGALYYDYINAGSKKIGYVDYLFVDRNVHSKGVGRKLVDTCLELFKRDGCYGCSAIIRDDNVASFKLFINRGLQRVGIENLVKHFGALGMLKLCVKTPMKIATGMDFYLKLEQDDISYDNQKTTYQIFKYLTFSLFLLLPTFIYGVERAGYMMAALFIVLLIRIGFGYIGTMLSKETWYFRVCDGGFIIPFVVSFVGGVYLISGNWYPSVYSRRDSFKRSLGYTALMQWFSLLGIVFISRTSLGGYALIRSMGIISSIFMIISIIPFYPLASFGGKRIYDINRWIYILVLIITLGINIL